MNKLFHMLQSPARSPKRGFTLIEMIVSSSIFIIVMLVIVGALISLNNASRKARATRIVLDNLSAAVDSMSRNIRMGSSFHCGCETNTQNYGVTKSCPMDTNGAGSAGDVCLAFEGPNGDPATLNDQIIYRLQEGRIERSTSGGAVGTFIGLTAPEIHVGNLRFFVYGTTQDTDQPLVTMVLQGSSTMSTKTTTSFDIQTTIAPRTPNFAPD